MPSREYPPTYGSRKAPWYDPLRLFTSSDSKADPPTPYHESQPISNDTLEAAAGGTPAWKWYGYGTPTPGRNPLAPNGSYVTVPANWYTATGTTPGAIPYTRIPTGPGLVPDPVPTPKFPAGPATSIALTPPDGPVVAPLPTADDLDWKSAPATLRVPTPDTATNTNGPRATLRAPVHADTPAPATPLQNELPTSTDAREVPVEAAPGIVVPSAGWMSRTDGPITARGLAPATDLPDAAIREACGPEVRVMEIAPVGPKRIVVRLAALLEVARTARERMTRLAVLQDWRVDFELVTPLK